MERNETVDFKLNKDEFIEIIDKLRVASDVTKQINQIFLANKRELDNDYLDGAGLGISHQELVVKLMEKLMHDEQHAIDYFVYEMDYGRELNFRKGCEPRYSTAEELYGYLIERYDKEDA